MSFGATNRLSSIAWKMASVPTRGSIGSVQRDEGRMALAASKPTAIACKWASRDEGTLTGVYVGPPTVATHSLFLPFPFIWCIYLLDVASRPMVRMLAKLTTLACCS